MSGALRSTWMILLAALAGAGPLSASGLSSGPELASYEDELFRWSAEAPEGCEVSPRDSSLAIRALRELERRTADKPFRVAVISSSRCAGETRIGLALKQSESSPVQQWLFVFGEDGALLQEIGPE